ncbi:interferon gamma receptor 1 isoform X2 [Octodon degus]|uniref:Interferon gamma receptor 1 n=1 Tax=Octodon degus TaxID=10160 RepID=A0A6P3EQ33_OCTDE|nr:interferon gamma receptor 1 isoform X2 [Octodon degus]
MAVPVLLLLLVRSGILAEMSTTEPEPSSVPLPTNVRIQSYNMNPVLYWDYQNMPQNVVFAVEVLRYGKTWTIACNNTHDHHCGISDVEEPNLPIWAKVKAIVGQRESAYVTTKSWFIVCEHGTVGPPEVTAAPEEDHIIIEVTHPLIQPNENESETADDFENPCYDFDYKVYVRVNGSEAIKYNLMGDECSDVACRLRVPVPLLNSEYCISAEGISERWDLKTEKSKESCITIYSRSLSDSVWIAVGATTLLFLIVILVLVYYFKKNPCKKNNITLPKSLLSVVRSATSDTKPESKYLSLNSSYQPITENAVVVSAEEVSPVTGSGPCYPGDEAQREDPPTMPTTHMADPLPSGSDLASSSLPAVSGSSLHSGSSQSEPCAVFLNSYHSRNGSNSSLVGIPESETPASDKNEAKTEGQEPKVLRSAPTSFGYDKPHVLVELLVGDEGAKESLVGYRLTTDSKEFP